MAKHHALLKQTGDFLRQNRLIKAGEHLLAAVSGGRDSVVLLDILENLRHELAFSLSVAHFDHGLRPQSADEQKFVHRLADSYGLPFYGGGAKAGSLFAAGNLEDAARRARYDFLRQTADQAGAGKIATAHHGQDQAETLLLHLLRGCGLEGLAAIAPLEREVLRPLLFALPEQIEEYRAAHNLAFCQDESNADPRYLRNHLRLNILPQLQEINPALLSALSATAEICREDNNFLDKLAEEALAELWHSDRQFISEKLYALPMALQRRLLRLALAKVSQGQQELSYGQTNAALKLKEEQSVSVGGGWRIYRRGGLFISRAKQPKLPRHQEIIPLLIDGSWHQLAAWGWEYQADEDMAAKKCPPGAYSIMLPASVGDRLSFRTRREGDAIPSTGKAGRRKLKDIFIDAKIPPHQRSGWPLLLLGEDIIWLPRLYQGQISPAKPGILIWAREITK